MEDGERVRAFSSFWKLSCERREGASVVGPLGPKESFVLWLVFEMRALCLSQCCWEGGSQKLIREHLYQHD